MKMTLQDYIDNPMGGRVGQKDLIRRFYTEKFDKVLLRENGHIGHSMYIIGNKYLVHFKIPSEAVNGVFYDVVFEFSPSAKVDNDSQTIDSYNVKFFSNDPAFVFNYAYAFNKKDLLIENLSKKLGKQPLEEEPKTSNPNKVIGHVKSFYFAYLYMRLKGMFKKVVFTGNRKIYSEEAFLKQIATASDKLAERQEAAVAKAKSTRAKEAHKDNSSLNPKNKGGIIDTIKTKLVKNTKQVKTVRKTKLTKAKK